MQAHGLYWLKLSPFHECKASHALVEYPRAQSNACSFYHSLCSCSLRPDTSDQVLALPFQFSQAASCVEAPATPNPSPQQTPKQAITPLTTPTPSPNPKGLAKAVDSPALDKLRALLRDHADSRAKSAAPTTGAVGKRVCSLLTPRSPPPPPQPLVPGFLLTALHHQSCPEVIISPTPFACRTLGSGTSNAEQ